MLIAALAVIQIRSQQEVERRLAGQDNTTLAFLIDDLHRGNDALASEEAALQAQRDLLRSGGPNEVTGALDSEQRRLRAAIGQGPVAGPGVVLSIDAPLQATDVQDVVNNLRQGGAEAIEVNGRRIITGTVIRQVSGGVTIESGSVAAPYVFTAIGDPVRLQSIGALMVKSLRADPRVRQASIRSDPNLTINSTVSPRPFLYAS